MGNPVSEAEARRAARRARAAGARSCFPVPVPQQMPGVWTGAPSCSLRQQEDGWGRGPLDPANLLTLIPPAQGEDSLRGAGGALLPCLGDPGPPFPSEAALIAPVCALPLAAVTDTIHQMQHHNPFVLTKCFARQGSATRVMNPDSPRKRRDGANTEGWGDRQIEASEEKPNMIIIHNK